MEYLLKASVIISVFYVCYYVLLKKETFFQHNRWFLLLGLVTAVTLPLVVIPIAIPAEPIVFEYNISPIENTGTLEQVSNNHNPFDWWSLLPFIYTIGLVIFLLRFMLQFGSLLQLLLRHPKLKDGIYTYVIVKSNLSPFSFFKWIVYNPESMDDEEVRLMLKHEKVHVNQMHSIDIILSQLACSMFWFHPLIWTYRNTIRQNLEFIADFKTQASTHDSKSYQKLLLKTSVANHNLSLTNNFYNSLIKERIVMLQKTRSQSQKQWRFALIIPLLALVLMSMNTKEVYVETSSASATEVSDEVFNPEIEIVFTKATTGQQIEQIKKELKSNGITMVINDLKRNSIGDIVSINVDFNTSNGSANYSISDDNGISDFYFRRSKDGSFGVGALSKEFIIVEEKDNTNVISADKILIRNNDDTVQEIIIEEDKDDIKILNGKTMVFKSDDDTEVVIKIDSASSLNSWTNKNNFTYKLNSLVDTIHVEQEVKVIRADGNTFEYKVGDIKKGENYDIKFIEGDSGKNPLFIINGEAKDKSVIQTLDTDKIKSVTVLKEDNAVSLYGEKAKDGVIIVETQKSVKNNKPKSKWVISKPQVSSITYVDDKDTRKNATLAYITKYTPDDILDKNKALLEKAGISVKYSKIRRNKAGEITSIKIKIKNNSGDESSASWKNDDGISGIEYGISEGALVARTSEMNFNND
ncbi:hypothetical protein J4050_05905 [Winogradskyella sp. DF17]|uniref:Peptidase M56 domain-containing protein n=1 Tax=Winogradskyella pelagia TaxID=2819984 RepID=A0ABS3T0K2_9FLAO|nr:M56 family metallopeptidase [Winogradskyella sp. DF17]MBO3116272.1 hypothetical protein [Winogradskyella sp. DF17]